jgi:hypothetical protein
MNAHEAVGRKTRARHERALDFSGRKETHPATYAPAGKQSWGRGERSQRPGPRWKGPERGSASVQTRMKIERRASLEKPNVTVETVRVSRRPKSAREASAKSIWRKHRGSGAGMYAEEQAVNMGDPKQRKGESQSNLETVRFSTGLNGESERSIVAEKRVMIVEPRDLSSRSTQKQQEPGRLTSV